MAYQHRFQDGTPIPLPVGKVVCVGRNYLDHIREMDNPVPAAPVLFMKPPAALASLEQPLRIPRKQGACHHEIELAVLIGQTLCGVNTDVARQSVVGYAVALDLTLRDVQNRLKQQGHPWERAKAFDGACPIGPFLRPDALPDPQRIDLALQVNGKLRQQGNTRQMIWGVFALIAHISQYFSLWPGDVVLTGTPAGVGELKSGDELILMLAGYHFTARVN